MPKIQVLSDSVANKIAAGEVVERPASVVKELIENSIDAGARRIGVEILDGGKKFIRVTDDGCGMDEADAELSLRRFATSKLRSERDLESILTLGFRGEALPSISEVSDFTLVTKPADRAEAVKIVLKGGGRAEVSRCAAPAGTSIEVRNLFFNVPARLKFMKTAQTEYSAVTALVTTYALLRPDVTFRLLSAEREALFAESTPDRGQRILSLFGREVFGALLPVRLERDGLVIEGFCAHPRLNRQNRGWQYFFVNGRPVSSPVLGFSLQTAYHSLVFRDRFPVCFLWITVPPGQTDVNIHPTKKEIKFSNEQQVRSIVIGAVMRALTEAKLLDAPAETSAVSEPAATYQAASAGPQPYFSPAPAYVEAPAPQTAADPVPQADLLSDYRPAQHAKTADHQLRIIGQFGQTYILAEKNKKLLVFDQHAAHERVLYEELMAQAKSRRVSSQRLLTPVLIDLAAPQAAALEEFLPKLAPLGIEVSAFGGRTYSVDALPAIFNAANPALFLTDLVDALCDVPKPELADVSAAEEIIIRMSCRAAVKARDRLSEHEMLTLVQRLNRCRTPHTCPHGRPTVIEIEPKELEKRFKRKE